MSQFLHIHAQWDGEKYCADFCGVPVYGKGPTELRAELKELGAIGPIRLHLDRKIND